MVTWGTPQVGSRNKAEEVREVLYLLAVGYFRFQDYEHSRSVCTQLLEVGGWGPSFCGAFFSRSVVFHGFGIVGRRWGSESGVGN